MCEFLSIDVDKEGRVYALLGKERIEAIRKGENPDSHSYISEVYGLNDDNVWKYELPIDTKEGLEVLDNTDKLMGALKYDGGLLEEKIPYSIVKGMYEWVASHKDEIKKAYSMNGITGRVDEIIEQSKEKEGEGILITFEYDVPLIKHLLGNADTDSKPVKVNGVTLYYDKRDTDKWARRWFLKYRKHEYAIIDEEGKPEKKVEPRLIVNAIVEEMYAN